MYQLNTRKALLWAIAAIFFLVLGWLLGYVRGSMEASTEHHIEMKKQRARLHLDQLVQSISNYHRATGRWPCKHNGSSDLTYGGDTQKEIIYCLLERVGTSQVDFL